ncbi:MAG: S9 family peptidase [Pseudomonadota bacterium]|nr:S9 family peptidase [Pseudomonadota bacterium]
MPFDASAASPPIAARKPASSTHHGIELLDDYGWMRADNWQEVMRDPSLLADDIRAHLEAENAYQQALMADTEALQKELVAEMRGRIKEDDSSVPMKDGPWAYGTRYAEGEEHPKFVRVPAGGGAETVMLDGEREAEGKSFFKIGSSGHSPDHRLLCWSYDDTGSELYTLHFRDLETGSDLADSIPETGGGGVFSSDTKQFVYTRIDANHRPSKLFLHRIGEPAENDTLLYEETDPGMFLSAGKTQSGAYIVFNTHDHESSQSWLVPASRPDATPVLIAEREANVQYSVDEGDGTLYILTNRPGRGGESAKDFRIVTAPAGNPGVENWNDLIPHKPGRLILGHDIYKRHLVRLERENGLPRIVIRRLSDGEEHHIAFDEDAYSLALGGSMEFDTDVIRFSYSSMTTPGRVYDYDMETRKRTLLKQQEVPSGHDPDAYVTHRIFALASDGETVPVTLLYARSTPLDGTAPCLLYGYGSYGITLSASFNTNFLSLVDRGFVYAIAHVRGGKDKGYAWYENGKREHKTNTFTDFVAAAEHLIAEKITGRGRIVAEGGSAGGMLMGAITNLAPDLFAGIIAEVPFVDVLNTMLDDTLPLTPPEWPEWGNPLASREDYEAIASWSPYDNIVDRHYPPIMAIGGLTDPRVTYWEPAKWVARLREHQKGDAPIMLKTNMGAGHAGAPGRFQRLDEVAFSYAFALKVAGKAPMPSA